MKMNKCVFAFAIANCDVSAVGYRQTETYHYPFNDAPLKSEKVHEKVYYAILKSGVECIVSETQFTEIKKHIDHINTLK